jgi:hypothetical protein
MSKSLYRQITPVATSLTGFHACFHAKADPSMNFRSQSIFLDSPAKFHCKIDSLTGFPPCIRPSTTWTSR